MKTVEAWSLLKAFWAPRHIQPIEPAEEMVITDALSIRRLIGDLTRTGKLLSLQTSDGAPACAGKLQSDAAGRLLLFVQPQEGGSPGIPPMRVNVTASAESSMLLFTLGPLTQKAAGRLSCAWPQQLVQMQSRRHFRVCGLTGAKHRATLELPGTSSALPLRDLSEEGVGFVLGSCSESGDNRYANAKLTLDEERISVPWVQVVHRRARQQGSQCAVGAQLISLAVEDTRRLRRWIATAQAAMSGPAAPT